ncbi:MAG: flagellar biosynthesis protein FlhB [Calditrichia bacterium]
MSSKDSKTEKATPKRRQEAVEKGDVARSMEINTAAVMLSVLMAFWFGGAGLWHTLKLYLQSVFVLSSSTDLTIETLPTLLTDAGLVAMKLLAPILLTISTFSILSNISQTGLIFSQKSLKPQFDKLNPMNGFKRLFSSRSLIETLKGFLKIGIVGTVGYFVLIKYIEEYPLLAHRSIPEIVSFLFSVIFELSIKAVLAISILAVMDLAYQRWEYARKLKMSKQEIKDEHKQAEGDPKVKGQLQAQQRELIRHRMMSAVPEATVVVTNPTHIAVALKYDPSSKSDAPLLVAKGQNKIAERIKEIAGENNIPVIENKPLARSLFKLGEINMEIPIEHYQAVAEILTLIWQDRDLPSNRKDQN